MWKKTFGLKVLDPPKKFWYKKNVRSHKVLVQEIKIKKDSSNKTLGPEKFGVQKIFKGAVHVKVNLFWK